MPVSHWWRHWLIVVDFMFKKDKSLMVEKGDEEGFHSHSTSTLWHMVKNPGSSSWLWNSVINQGIHCAANLCICNWPWMIFFEPKMILMFWANWWTLKLSKPKYSILVPLSEVASNYHLSKRNFYEYSTAKYPSIHRQMHHLHVQIHLPTITSESGKIFIEPPSYTTFYNGNIAIWIVNHRYKINH